MNSIAVVLGCKLDATLVEGASITPVPRNLVTYSWRSAISLASLDCYSWYLGEAQLVLV